MSASGPLVSLELIYIYSQDFIVERKAKIRNRYDQVSYLTRNTIWESDKTQENKTHIIFIYPSSVAIYLSYISKK